MLTLIDKGMVREEAYDIVQPKAMEAWETQVQFKELVEADERITSKLTQEEINECFNYEHHMQHVDTIFERLGLNEAYFIWHRIESFCAILYKNIIHIFQTTGACEMQKLELLYEGKAKEFIVQNQQIWFG